MTEVGGSADFFKKVFATPLQGKRDCAILFAVDPKEGRTNKDNKKEKDKNNEVRWTHKEDDESP